MKPLFVACAFCLVTTSTLAGEAARDGSGESFPLRKGLQALYSYQWQNLSIDIMTGGTQVTDSGTVAYQVVDSAAATDSSEIWTVTETEHLLHRHYRVTTSTSVQDSAYWVDMSWNFSVVEDLTGLHRLHGSALVWSFPVRDTLMNIGYGRQDSAVDVFRFGAFGSRIVVNLWNGNSWIDDTVTLKPGEGLTTRVLEKGDASNVKNNYSVKVSLISTTAGVEPSSGAVPSSFALDQNYPNPFNPSTTIRYNLPARSPVSLDLFNMLGQQVATIVREEQNAGRHEVKFDGTGLSSGTYVYRLVAGGATASRILVLLK